MLLRIECVMLNSHGFCKKSLNKMLKGKVSIANLVKKMEKKKD